MTSVILVRWVGYEGKGEYYARRVSLPLAPFAGLGVPVHEQRGRENVKEVYVNQLGSVIALLAPDEWSRDHCPWESWPAQHDWLTRGWYPVGKDPCWETSPP